MFIKSVLTEIKWIQRAIYKRVLPHLYSLRYLYNKPKYPVSQDGKIRVHLGCGNVEASNFINVDLQPGHHIHHVHSISNLPFFNNNSIDLLYACHALEHISPDHLKDTLSEWHRVLKPGATLRLSVPDFDKLIEVYQHSNHDVESIRQPLLGVPAGYNSHLLLFNHSHLKKQLEIHGFKNVRHWDPYQVVDHDFTDWANTPISHNDKSFLISLNMEADKA